MTDASSGYSWSHSSASAREEPHLTPTAPSPRKAKILSPTLATRSPSHGSSGQAPGLASAWAAMFWPSRDRRVMPSARRSSRGRAHLAQLLLEVPDLVPKAGSELEMEVTRGLVHLRGELLDEPGEVARRHRLRTARSEGDVGHCSSPPAATAVTLAAGLGPPRTEQLPCVEVLALEHVGDVGDPLPQWLWVHPVREVVGDLLLPPALGLLDRPGHRRGDLVGIHVHLAGHVARRAPDRLDEAATGPEEALLVGVEDRDEGDLGEVEPFPEQVDADEDVELAETELTQELHAPQGVDVRVEVADPNPLVEEVVGEVLRHLLRQGRHEDPLVAVGSTPDLVEQVVDLPLRRLEDDLGVDEPGRADDLLDHAIGLGHLVRPGRRREVDGLADPVEELLPLQWAVVHGRREPEAVVDEGALARHVTLVHRPDLRHRDVRLVDDEEEVLGEVVDEAVGRRSPWSPVDVHGVVLDAGARPDLPHHLDVVGRPHPQALRLEELALPLEQGELLLELLLDADDGTLHPSRPCDVVRRREDVHLVLVPHHLAGHRVEGVERLDLVSEELDADRQLLVHRDDLDGVPTDSES